MPEDDIPGLRDRADRLPNLQLLVDEVNESKSAKLPKEWMDEPSVRRPRSMPNATISAMSRPT